MSDEEDYAPTPAQVEFQKRLEYTEDGLDAIDSHRPMAQVIWETNHRDEDGLSVTGADNIAKALIMAGYSKLSHELPQEPQPVPSYQWRVVGAVWGGDRMGSEDAMRHYARMHGGTLQRRVADWETVE